MNNINRHAFFGFCIIMMSKLKNFLTFFARFQIYFYIYFLR